MTQPKRSLDEAMTNLMNKIDEEILDDFLEDEFDEEHLEERYFGDTFSGLELDYMFDALVDAYREEMNKGSGMIPSMVLWRVLQKFTDGTDRWEVDEEEMEEAMEKQEKDSVSRTFQ